MRSRSVVALLLAGGITALAAHQAIDRPSRGGAPTSGLIGFSPAALERERKAEASFMAGVSPDAMADLHRRITARPHVAGSPASMEVAATLVRALADAGLETEVDDYEVLLSTPESIRVAIIAPRKRDLPVTEPARPEEPASSHPDLGPGYVAYSASGSAAAPVVYVNYGLPPDYARVNAAGIDVKGKIVIARYARSHRAVKIHTAQQNGAAAIVIYSDPADDGFARGLEWPDGPWRADFQLQRGNGKFSWFWHGDPLSPGFAARAGTRVLDPSTAPTLPRIPAVVLSAKAAAEILSGLGGPPAPSGFQGGLPFTYRLGGAALALSVDVRMNQARRRIRNVLARLRGRDADRWVILGTHHDAWTFGGMDPGSGVAAVFGVARSLGVLNKAGWTPERTIVFAFWDAEEFGLIGSTEYAEAFARELREKAVAYINTDLYMRGRFDGGGTPSLRDFLVEVTKDVPSFTGTGSVYDGWRADAWRREPAERRRRGEAGFEVDLAALGSGADFVAFQDHLGLPTLQMEFDFEGSYGTYHSNYDTRRYVERFADPGFEVGASLVRVLGLSVMRLANAVILPLRYSYYARKIDEFLDTASTWALDDDGRPIATLDLARSRQLADAIRQRAAELEGRIDRDLASSTWTPATAARLNDRLARLEQTLLDEQAPADKRWYRHVIYGWNIYSLYEGQPLPGLAEAIRLRDTARIREETTRIEAALGRMLAALDKAGS